MATGGTEGNIQGLWVQRNFFIEKFNANFSEIALISSEDTHYSIDKAANLLGLIRYSIKVDMNTREIVESDLRNCIKKAKREGKKYFCCILNMGTTMFGSVDDIDSFTRVMNSLDIEYGIHVDAAFGGFIYPFVNKSSKLSFKNEKINSFSLDAHKMLQAPYGSGIFLMKKGLVKNVISSSAKYVKGMDSTLCGSRSGANAIATWMILSSYGSSGGVRFCNNLISITNIFCKKLDSINVKYYRNMFMNVIAISSESINEELAREFFLVPDTHNSRPNWWKIVVMDHVEVEHLDLFFSKLNS
jgi:glutamate/tyrosine decarboxylase-like PLP-dependent enzyme